MKNLRLSFLLILSLLLTVASCKKDEETEPEKEPIDNQTTASRDNNNAENIFGDIKRVVEEAVNDEGQSNPGSGSKLTGYSFGNCALVSVNTTWADTTVWPKTVTIDFGTSNCTGNNGVNRRGKIIVVVSDRYRNPGSVLTVTTDNYYVNDHKVDGVKTLTNNGRNAANNLTFTVQVSNGIVTYPSGSTFNWQSTRTNEWIEGESTTLFTNGFAGVCDDVYLITGNASGTNVNDLSFTVNITSALRKEMCCRWIVSGALDIIPQGKLTRSVNYGNGTCDHIATVTIAGISFQVPMF